MRRHCAQLMHNNDTRRKHAVRMCGTSPRPKRATFGHVYFKKGGNKVSVRFGIALVNRFMHLNLTLYFTKVHNQSNLINKINNQSSL